MRNLPIIADIEKEVKCGGLCTKTPTYIMFGINEGPPPVECQGNVQDFLLKKFNRIEWPCLVGFVIGLLTFIFSLAYCCRIKENRF